MIDFDKLTLKEKETSLIKPALKTLRQLGGGVTRKQLMREVVQNTEWLPDDILTKFRTAKKTGNKYNPFFFNFNFAVRYLKVGKYVEQRGHLLYPTDKGINVDIDHSDFDKKLANHVYKDYRGRQKSRENKEKVSEEEQVSAELEEPKWETNLKAAFLTLSPAKFEVFCRALMKKMGIKVDEHIGVKLSGDGGLDGFGYMRNDDFRTERVAIQAKKWKPDNLVSSPEIDKFRGAMDKFRSEYGIFITTSDFTKDAIKASRSGSHVITLINGDELLNLAIKCGVYVKKIYVPDENFFDKNN